MILSVDYTLAPEGQHPRMVNEAFYACETRPFPFLRLLRLFFGDRGSGRKMLPNSLS